MVNNYNSFLESTEIHAEENVEVTEKLLVKQDVIQQILNYSRSLEVLNSEALQDVFIIKN